MRPTTKLLIVDDDASVRESLGRVLGDAGYEVLEAADGQQALAQFRQHDIDLLILDIGLPILSGWEAFERITRLRPTLPIIVITGQSDQYDVAVAAGAGALMEKPLDAPKLLETVDGLMFESREENLRRLCGRGSITRHVPNASARLLQDLRSRCNTPVRGLFKQGLLTR